MFILGLQCGIEGAYFTAADGAPAYSGVFTAWCDLREITPYAFGYMMSAKVGTGIVAELGAMRISDEIDALEVMGINSMTFLCATRLLASWLVLPFMYMAGIGAAFLASYIAVVDQIGYVSSGGYFLIFWQFQNPPDFLYSLIKAMFMATAIVLVALLLRVQRQRRPGRRRQGHRQVDGAQPDTGPRDRDARNPDLLGRQPTSTDRRSEHPAGPCSPSRLAAYETRADTTWSRTVCCHVVPRFSRSELGRRPGLMRTRRLPAETYALGRTAFKPLGALGRGASAGSRPVEQPS